MRTPDDVYLANVVLELRDGLTGEQLYAEDFALPGTYQDGPLSVVTNSDGF